MKVYLLLICSWISLISFCQENISIDTIVLNGCDIPRVTDKLDSGNLIVNKINESILDRFGLEDYDSSRLVGFSWYGVKFNSEINSNILLISFSGEYVGAYPNNVNDCMYFDLTNGNSIDEGHIPYNALFSLEGFYSFLNKYWIPGCRPEVENAIKCVGSDIGCSCFDIDFSVTKGNITFRLVSNFPHVVQNCSPYYSITVQSDSLKSYLNNFGKYLIYESSYYTMSRLKRFLFYKQNSGSIPKYYYIVGNIDNKYPFSMALELNDSSKEVIGYYFYNKQNKNISLKGRFDLAQINLSESINKKTTGQFVFIWHDTFQDDGFSVGNRYLTGKWTNFDSKKDMKIKLTDIIVNK